MTTGMIGADPQALREMASKFDAAAQDLGGTKASVQTWVDRSDIWRGLDNRRFVSHWNSTGVQAMTATADALRQAAEILRAQAEEQDQTSAAGAGVNTGSGLFQSPSQSQPLMAGINAGVQSVLGVADGVLGWTADALDTAFTTTKFGIAGALATGASAGWALADDITTNGGQRFFEISAGASVGLVGGLVGMTKGAAVGAAIGSVFPGPGTMIGAVIGGTVGGIGGSMAGGAAGGGIGSMMDHALRGEGADFVGQKAAEFSSSAKSVLTAGVALPFAF